MKRLLVGLILALLLSLLLGTTVSASGQPDGLDNGSPGIILIDLSSPGQPGFFQGGDPSTPGPDIVIIPK